MWLTSAYGMLLTVFPALVASPRYFAGAITLGVLMQISSAFYQVTGSLNWFVDSWPKARRVRPWMRSLAGKYGDPKQEAEPLTPLERILVVMVIIVVVLFEVWFFFFAGSPLPKQ